MQTLTETCTLNRLEVACASRPWRSQCRSGGSCVGFITRSTFLMTSRAKLHNKSGFVKEKGRLFPLHSCYVKDGSVAHDRSVSSRRNLTFSLKTKAEAVAPDPFCLKGINVSQPFLRSRCMHLQGRFLLWNPVEQSADRLRLNLQ